MARLGRLEPALDGRRFDLAVVVGGLAGVASALAAAGRGAATLLIEESPRLGGNATGAFVHTFCGLYLNESAQAPHFANPGLARDFAEGLRAAGGAGDPERVGRVWVLPSDPPAIARHAESLCAASPTLTTRLTCRVVAARLALGDAQRSALLLADAQAPPGDPARATVEAGLVIDASGDGALVELAGADGERAAPDERQLPSYIARLAGVPAEDVAGYGRLRLAVAVAGAARERRLPDGCDSVLLRPAGRDGEAYLTLNVPREQVTAAGADGPGARQALAAWSRRGVEAVVAHLRETRPGYADCRVVAWPERLGVREGTRLRGRERLESDALLRGVRRDDEVALSSWPIELWHDHRGARFRHPEAVCGIPLGALVSRSHPRLGMAGRCLSASHEALGALRVLGTALATGEAIGLAAALAAERGVTFADVEPARVRQLRSSAIATSLAR